MFPVQSTLKVHTTHSEYSDQFITPQASSQLRIPLSAQIPFLKIVSLLMSKFDLGVDLWPQTVISRNLINGSLGLNIDLRIFVRFLIFYSVFFEVFLGWVRVIIGFVVGDGLIVLINFSFIIKVVFRRRRRRKLRTVFLVDLKLERMRILLAFGLVLASIVVEMVVCRETQNSICLKHLKTF